MYGRTLRASAPISHPLLSQHFLLLFVCLCHTLSLLSLCFVNYFLPFLWLSLPHIEPSLIHSSHQQSELSI